MAERLPRVVERYLEGESLNELAAENGVSRRTVYCWLLAGLGDKRYHEVVTQALVNRIADADELLEGARDPVQIARAREMARFARMDFERRRPGLYGQKQLNVTVSEVTVRQGTVGRAGELLKLVAKAAQPVEVTNALTMPFTVVDGPEEDEADAGPAG